MSDPSFRKGPDWLTWVCVGLVVLALLLSPEEANAQASPAEGCDAATHLCTDQGAAYAAAAGNNVNVAACTNGGEERIAARGTPVSGYVKERRCKDAAGNFFPWSTPLTAENPIWDFPSGATCSTRLDETGWDYNTASPTMVCNNGCAYEGALDASSPTGASYNPTGETCEQNEDNSPVIDTDGDGVPDEDDAFPNDPSESTDSDGDGVGDNADFSPDDPDNGEDTPGEEDGDDEGDNQASGGGTCEAAPTCSGDAIQCAQLYQQWKIRCDLGAKVTGSPEVCEAAYTCTGDTAQCAQVALLRKEACKAVVGPGDGDGAAQTLLEGLQGGPGDSNLDPMSIWAGDDGGDADDPDDSGFGLSRACPPPVTWMGKSLEMPCNLGQIIAAIVLLAGMIQFAYAFTGKE